ncbi:MAG: FtsH protease activity modulator HflK [Steroidobacteraceae bacterium]
MAWNQPDDNKPRAPQRAAVIQRRWQRWLRSPPRWPGARSLALIGAIILLGWIATGLHQINPGERGQVLRLGREVALLGPGSAWRLPWPIETLRVIDVDTVRSMEFDSRMRGSGADLYDVALMVRYRVGDARSYLSGPADADATLRFVSESALRAQVADLQPEEMLQPERRRTLIEPVRAAIQARLDALQSGLSVEDVEIERADVPPLANSGAQALSDAVNQRELAAGQARAYEAQILPPAQQQVEQSLAAARTYRSDTIAAAEIEAARFEALLPAYQAAPKVLRQRLYIEAVEEILTRARKVVVDNRAGAGAPIYLPLDKLLNGEAPPAPPAAKAPAASGGVDERSIEDARSRERITR